MTTADSELRRALDRLYRLGPGRMQPGRDRLRRLLAHAGDPHLAVPSLLIGGTNGKGRVVSALSAVLSTHYATGAFIKPHLVSIRERWRINEQPVSPRAFSAATHQACDLIERHDEPISFFEANVLIGALLFVEAGCDVAVWEVGLGGREDACNLVDPLVSLITNVGYDHQDILGSTLGEIARDKAGIGRRDRPLLLGPHRPGWEDEYRGYAPVIEQACRAAGARFLALGQPRAEDWDRYVESGGRGLPPDTFKMVTGVLSELKRATDGRLVVPAVAMLAGLTRLYYRARIEHTALKCVPVLLDAANNVDSLRWLARLLMRLHPGRRFPVVFGCQVSRDPRVLLAELAPVIERLVPLEVPVLHPCPLGEIIAAARDLDIEITLPALVQAGPEPRDYAIGATTEFDPPDNRTRWLECVEHGLSLSTHQAPTVICGSIYILGEVLRAFE